MAGFFPAPNKEECMNADPRVCESCLEAATDEGLSDDEAAAFCMELGSELSDHLCEEIELQGEVRCMCSCHQPTKHSLRHDSVASGRVS